MFSLYENIKNRRLELKMTQSDLAALTGYSDKSMIARIEQGKVDLPQSKIVIFSDALGVSPAYLMGWEDTAADQDHVADAIQMVPSGLSDEAMRIGSAYDAAEEWEKDAVAKLLDVKRDSNAEVLGA